MIHQQTCLCIVHTSAYFVSHDVGNYFFASNNMFYRHKSLCFSAVSRGSSHGIPRAPVGVSWDATGSHHDTLRTESRGTSQGTPWDPPESRGGARLNPAGFHGVPCVPSCSNLIFTVVPRESHGNPRHLSGSHDNTLCLRTSTSCNLNKLQRSIEPVKTVFSLNLLGSRDSDLKSDKYGCIDLLGMACNSLSIIILGAFRTSPYAAVVRMHPLHRQPQLPRVADI